MTQRPRADTIFFYSAKTQFSNAGDALINRELLRHLRRYGEIRAAVAGAPADFLAEIGLREDERRFAGRAGMVVAAASAGLRRRLGRGPDAFLVLTPGDPLVPLSPSVLLGALAVAGIAASGTRVLRLGVSMTSNLPRRMRLEALLSRAIHFTGLRDTLSMAATERAGFRRSGYFPDFAMTMPAVRRSARPDAAPLRIGLSFRDDRLGESGIEPLAVALESILADAARDRPVELALVAQVEADAVPAKLLLERFGARYPCSLVVERRLDRLAEIYRGIDLVLSNRLHGLLYAAANGCIPVGLLSRRANSKIVGLLADIGLGDLWVDLERDPAPTLDLARLEALQPAVAQAFVRARGIACERFEVLVGAPGAAPQKMLTT